MEQIISKAFQWKNSLYSSLVSPGMEMPICKKHRLMGDDVRVWGYPNKKGCFSARVVGNLIDVAYYPDIHPREIDQSVMDNALYELFPNESGWGFAALDSLRKMGVDVWKKELRDSDDASELNLFLGIEE